MPSRNAARVASVVLDFPLARRSVAERATEIRFLDDRDRSPTTHEFGLRNANGVSDAHVRKPAAQHGGRTGAVGDPAPIESAGGCGIDFQSIVDVWETALPRYWHDSDAKAAMMGFAPAILSGAELTCFVDTIDRRISR